MSTPHKNYTQPKVKVTGKDWYVWFRFLDEKTNTRKLIIKKCGVNNKNLPTRERIAQLNALKKAIKFKLEEQGWNPIDNTYPYKTPEQLQMEKLMDMGLNEALDFALSKCNVATKTKLDYGTTLRFVKLGSEQIGLSRLKIIEVKRQHIKQLLEHIKKDRKWSNKAYNKNKGYLSAIVDRLMDWDIIETNPVRNIKSLPTTETEKFLPLTVDEKKIIQEYLFLHHYGFFVFLMVIYHTGIRPKEALALKIKDISSDLSEILIIPDLISENSKTKKVRRVPINQHLQLLLRELQLQDHDKDFFVFGSPFVLRNSNNSKSVYGRGAMHAEYFKPSVNQVKRDTATKLWKAIVKDKLGIDKYQYALKHSGANDKILAGIEIDALQELYGHSSKLMTAKYATKIKEVYKKQIIDLSPSF